MNAANQKHQTIGKGEKLLKRLLVGIIAILLVVLALLLYAQTRPYPPSGRATCIMNIRNFQTGARSRMALVPEQAPREAPVEMSAVYSFMGMAADTCPSGGTYTVHGHYGDPPGTVFLRCSDPEHVPTPTQTANW